jgi:5-methylcytosine-specific restriction endonuclease McrA
MRRARKFTCQSAKSSAAITTPAIDHVVPRHLGGKHEWTNVVAACSACNHRKGGRLLAESGMILLHFPQVPSKKASYVFARHLSGNSEWETFLNGW